MLFFYNFNMQLGPVVAVLIVVGLYQGPPEGVLEEEAGYRYRRVIRGHCTIESPT